ncbi:MAG TPA: hypothetical protein VNZ85_16090 [Caulobacter sp.]|nr:hypothetical protein [Caulobacter sp.]
MLAAFFAIALSGAPQVSNTLDQVGLTWSDAPTRFDLERAAPLFPAKVGAWRPDVHLTCTARSNGRLDCISLERGDTTLAASARRVMSGTRVKTVDGDSPEGRTFAFTLRFGEPRQASRLTTTSLQ